jgi:copper chaperone CopZ
MDATQTKTVYALKLLIAAAIIVTANAPLAAQQPARFEVQIVADDMCCQGCAQTIAAQLYAAPGVTAVITDIPNRTVKVTAKASPKLTLERLWRAVEKGKGSPSKLISAEATYSLTRADQLEAAEQPDPGNYVIHVAEMEVASDLQKTATFLRTIPGVERVNLDAIQRTIIVEAETDKPLSIWLLVHVVKQSGQLPLWIAGPHGRLAIEHVKHQPGRTAAQQRKTTY